MSLWVTAEVAQELADPTAFGRPDPLASSPPAFFSRTVVDGLGGHDLLISECLLGFVALVLLSRLLRPTDRAGGASVGADGGASVGADGGGSENRRHRLRVAAMLGAYLLWVGLQDLCMRNRAEHYWLSYWPFAAAGVVWAVAIAVLVIRDHGWRLDRAARSVLIGLLLGTGVTGLFVVATAVLSAWLLPGRGGAALVLIALVYALGATLPRGARRVVALVDRLYYGERVQPYQVLRTLAERVRQVVDPEQLPAALCATVPEELRLPGGTLAVTTRAGRRTLATAGRLDGRAQGFALVHNGLPIGELTVGLRAGEERLAATSVDILRSLADQADGTDGEHGGRRAAQGGEPVATAGRVVQRLPRGEDPAARGQPAGEHHGGRFDGLAGKLVDPAPGGRVSTVSPARTDGRCSGSISRW
ncbi:hypothetical protein [Kitasatospora sp. NPDC017646]|uniref:hypothetical protein n=1 Tax=Kitasatospora sp. NPDC017646 TaxID=3364024 RepID=UPI00378D3F34